MIVLRVECGKCANQHGPMVHGGMCDDSVFSVINYGGAKEAPQSDSMLEGRIDPEEVCGTLPDQFDRWWSGDYNWITGDMTEPERKLTGRWVLSIYSVPEYDVRVGRNQVCFKKRGAVRVREFRSIEEFDKERELYSWQ